MSVNILEQGHFLDVLDAYVFFSRFNNNNNNVENNEYNGNPIERPQHHKGQPNKGHFASDWLKAMLKLYREF